MSVIAPWLKPTDTLAAIEGGARAGLSARQADQADAAREIAANEAAQRLRLSYDSLAQAREQQLRQDSRLRDVAKASNALRAQRAESLDEYRKAQARKISDAEAEKALESSHTSGAADLIAKGGNAMTAISKFPKANHSFISSVFENERATALEASRASRQENKDAEMQKRQEEREKAPKVTRTYEIPEVQEESTWHLRGPNTITRKHVPGYKETVTNPPPDYQPSQSTATAQPSVSIPTVKAGQIIENAKGERHTVTGDGTLPKGFKVVQ